jgi:hypothetical protein
VVGCRDAKQRDGFRLCQRSRHQTAAATAAAATAASATVATTAF